MLLLVWWDLREEGSVGKPLGNRQPLLPGSAEGQGRARSSCRRHPSAQPLLLAPLPTCASYLRDFSAGRRGLWTATWGQDSQLARRPSAQREWGCAGPACGAGSESACQMLEALRPKCKVPLCPFENFRNLVSCGAALQAPVSPLPSPPNSMLPYPFS